MNLVSRLRGPLLPALLGLALLGVVLGLKFDVVHRFGSDLPMWDQWDAEGSTVFVPRAAGTLSLEHIIRPHNEHRVALTRLYGLGTLLVNGQWDARLQCLLNALLHAGVALALFALARRLLGAAGSAVGFFVAAILIGLPLSWQNVVSGFHSPQYFLLLLTIGTVALLPTARPGSARWWGGAACGALVLFSMASGLFAAVAAAAVVVLQAWRGDAPGRGRWPTLALCVGLIAIGAALLVHYPGHDGLKARNATEFFLYALHSLEWPLSAPWAAALLWSPWVLLGAALARRSTPDPQSAALVVFAQGGWTFGQIIASAYARGAEAGYPASRYMDTLALGLAANALAAAWLVHRARGRLRWGALALLGAWSLAAGVGLHQLIRTNYREELPAARAYFARCETNVRAYVATGDAAQLKDDGFPYPNADDFRQRIDQPALRAILPASVRAPLRLETARGHDAFPEIAAGADPAWPARHRGSTAGRTGTWESVVVDFPHATTLRFRFRAAPLDGDAVELQWRDTRLGATVADVLAARTGGGPDYVATVDLPAGSYQLVARVSAANASLRFEEPVEVARFSEWAAHLAASGRGLALAGALAGLALLGFEHMRARR